MKGEASCKWTTGSGKNRKTYGDKEQFLNSVTYLFGSPNGEIVELSKEIYNYNFSCTLPIEIPSSIEGEFGNIRYTIDANLDIPWPLNMHTIIAFSVARYEDLNYFPELKRPLSVEQTHTFCCFLFTSKPIIMRCSLPKRGFAAGEAIPISFSLINNSSIDITQTKMKLERVFQCVGKNRHGHTRYKETRDTVIKLQNRGVRAGRSESVDELIQIPLNALMSNGKYCHIFRVIYVIVLKAKLAMCCESPVIHVPITIGTVQLQNVDSNLLVNHIALEPSAPPVNTTYLPSFPIGVFDPRKTD